MDGEKFNTRLLHTLMQLQRLFFQIHKFGITDIRVDLLESHQPFDLGCLGLQHRRRGLGHCRAHRGLRHLFALLQQLGNLGLMLRHQCSGVVFVDEAQFRTDGVQAYRLAALLGVLGHKREEEAGGR